MEPIKTTKGTNGQLTLYEDKIRISRKGLNAFLIHGLKGDKEIFLSQISSIQIKKAGLLAGYIQFTFLGGQEAKGGLMQGMQDENTITFSSKKQNEEFEVMKTMIEAQIKKLKANTTSGESNGLQDLKELKKLKDEGIITEEEFAQKKKIILGL